MDFQSQQCLCLALLELSQVQQLENRARTFSVPYFSVAITVTVTICHDMRDQTIFTDFTFAIPFYYFHWFYIGMDFVQISTKQTERSVNVKAAAS